jgi:ABC-2 type transport system ATP-binding protein
MPTIPPPTITTRIALEPRRRRRARASARPAADPATLACVKFHRMATVAGSREGIELHGLEKSFRTPRGRVEAVRGIDVSIAGGETVALLGPNGAGKSTTIDMLLGLSAPDRGTVSLFGRPPADAIASGAVGAMLQSGALLRDLTVRELVSMMASLYPRPLEIAEVLATTGTEEIADRRTQKLSGGQTQRVRLAVALVSNPELLVLDEPTAGMDVESRHAFWAAMRGFAARGTTVLFATHYLEEADAFADRAVLMAQGRIVADGPTTEIKARVGSRTIRATLPGADLGALAGLPGVAGADRHGEAVILVCSDSDAAIRALLAGYPDAKDIEITGAGLEQAFLELTGRDEEAGAGVALQEAAP